CGGGHCGSGERRPAQHGDPALRARPAPRPRERRQHDLHRRLEPARRGGVRLRRRARQRDLLRGERGARLPRGGGDRRGAAAAAAPLSDRRAAHRSRLTIQTRPPRRTYTASGGVGTGGTTFATGGIGCGGTARATGGRVSAGGATSTAGAGAVGPRCRKKNAAPAITASVAPPATAAPAHHHRRSSAVHAATSA